MISSHQGQDQVFPSAAPSPFQIEEGFHDRIRRLESQLQATEKWCEELAARIVALEQQQKK